MLCTKHSWRPAYGPFCRPHQQTALQCKDVRRQSPDAKVAALQFHIAIGFESQHQKNLSNIRLLPNPNLPTPTHGENQRKHGKTRRRAPPELRTNISPGLWCLGRLKSAPPRPCGCNGGIKVSRLLSFERLNLISRVVSGQIWQLIIISNPT